ncbi:hypothetical protein ACFQ51_22200 [Streptomyces kaempferi]
MTALEKYPDAGGYGTAAQAFATAYVEVGNRYLEVWARSVVSVGGAAVGFATTANNYSRAEAANDASGKTPPGAGTSGGHRQGPRLRTGPGPEMG